MQVGREAQTGAGTRRTSSFCQTPWLITLFGIPRLAVHLFADQSFGDFGEIGGKRGTQILKLRPQGVVDEATWAFDYNGLSVHPAISKRGKPVTTTQRDK